MTLRRMVLAGLLVAGLVLVSACDSAEERADKHYKAGLALLEAGDVDRALVEFRNVFKLDVKHHDARLAFAQAEQSRGNLREAYAQYLRLAEQYPEDIVALRALGELALDTYNWDEATRHIAAAVAVAPDDPLVMAMQATLDYRAAVEALDTKAEAAAVAVAVKMRDLIPQSLVPRRVIIDSFLRADNNADALAEIDAALAQNETDRELHRLRIALLDQAGDNAAVEVHLRKMIDLFPDDPSIQTSLVRWYMGHDDIDAAEAFLRDRLVDNSDSDKAARLTLIKFLADVRGPDAAIAELDTLIAAGGDTALFQSLRAGLEFDGGKPDEAIASMEAILAASAVSDETRQIKLGLARMLIGIGDQVGARKLVEEVLAEDQTEVEALKMRASWQIDADQTGDAIVTLRAALDQSPRDAEAMTLMASAHDRDGNHQLTGEMLALAVEASNNAPDESDRYARFLIADKKLLPAEDVLIDALRTVPGNPGLLSLLGQVYGEMQDWPRAEQVIKALRSLDDPEATSVANNLQAAVLTAQSKSDEALSFLEGLLDNGAGDVGVQAAVIRAQLNNGEIDAARAYSAEVLAKDPANPSLRFIHASVLEMAGDGDAAETEFRALVAEDSSQEAVWLALYRLLGSKNDAAAADEVLAQGLAAVPDSLNLKWALASLHDQRGEVDAAISVYEELYAANSSSPLVANNLASLLSTHRSDPDSQERAYVIARRLRGNEFPPFQDTYGWIAYQRGSYAEALDHLKPAAESLTDDASVQYHLAMAYLATGDLTGAKAQFQKVTEMTGADDARPFAESARTELAKLN